MFLRKVKVESLDKISYFIQPASDFPQIVWPVWANRFPTPGQDRLRRVVWNSISFNVHEKDIWGAVCHNICTQHAYLLRLDTVRIQHAVRNVAAQQLDRIGGVRTLLFVR